MLSRVEHKKSLITSTFLRTLFRQKLTNVLLESADGREWQQQIFHDQFTRNNVTGLDGNRIRDLLITSMTLILDLMNEICLLANTLVLGYDYVVTTLTG